MDGQRLLTVGEVAERTGLAPSAVRYYERLGLVRATRTPSGQRRFRRDVLRRIAFVRVAQRVGLSLEEIGEALSGLSADRAPTRAEWARISERWRGRLDERIRLLEGLRDGLTSCIGCGCLSLQACGLYNPGDVAGRLGAGPRYLLGDTTAEARVAAASAAPQVLATEPGAPPAGGRGVRMPRNGPSPRGRGGPRPRGGW